MRVRHALSRRLDVWELLPALQSTGESAADAAQCDPTRLSMCLADVAVFTREGGSEGNRWRNYLLLDTLESVAQASQRGSEDEARDFRTASCGVFCAAGSPLGSAISSPADRWRSWAMSFAAGPPSRSMPANCLPIWNDSSRRACPAMRRLAEHRRRLSWLAPEKAGKLADRVETHYRNANLRVAIGESFLDRLVPRSHTTTMPVNDRVLGYPVRGTSTTLTTLDVRLVPDPRRLRLALEANGSIHATTTSTSGPATVYNQSESHYFARKLMEVDLGGIHVSPTETDSDTTLQLRGVRTNFDGIPVLGALVENVVRSRHAEKKAEAGREVRRKISDSTKRQIDAETDARVAAANVQLRERCWRRWRGWICSRR